LCAFSYPQKIGVCIASTARLGDRLRGDYEWNPGEELVENTNLEIAMDAELRQQKLELGRVKVAKDLTEVAEQIEHDMERHEKLLAIARDNRKRYFEELWGSTDD
jgi:hypothetical protein